MEIIVFILCLIIFTFVGIASSFKQKSLKGKNYLLAGSSVSPFLIGLSAAATKYSGYMFIGLIGFIYTNGLVAIWLAIGFMFGDIMILTKIPKIIRQKASQTGALSFAALLASWNGQKHKYVQVLAGILILVFLVVYAAAQLNAGSKALQVILGWGKNSGAILCAGLILIYCLKGGLRASIWTDAIQAVVMIISLGTIVYFSFKISGGIGGYVKNLNNVAPNYMDLGVKQFGSVSALALFATGWLFNGLGVVGQPQVMVRFMALDKPENTKKAGIYFFIWSFIFLSCVVLVGLSTRLFVEGNINFDPELALPRLAQALLPAGLVGVAIAGIFSASISTADSQVLSCSAVLSEDFKWLKEHKYSRSISTLIILIFSLCIAILSPLNVFSLVIVAWSALGSSLGPIVLIYSFGQKMIQSRIITMMMIGLIVTLAWRWYGLHNFIYEGAPGILASLVYFFIQKYFFTTRVPSLQ